MNVSTSKKKKKKKHGVLYRDMELNMTFTLGFPPPPTIKKAVLLYQVIYSIVAYILYVCVRELLLYFLAINH